MFCPSCGAEYAQKINYCKRCGANMAVPTSTVEVHVPRPRFAGLFWAIAAMGILGLIVCFTAFNEFANEGLRGDNLIIPFVAGLLFVSGIASGLIWQLARLVSTFQRSVHQAQGETPPLPQPQPIAAPQEPVVSVSEHTTRSFDPVVYIEAERRRKYE